MKTYTIAQKMSGTGTIHDLASQHFDRDIRFRGHEKFAIVLAACYSGKGYTTHQTAEAAIKASRKCRGYSHSILDVEGNEWSIAELVQEYGLTNIRPW